MRVHARWAHEDGERDIALTPHSVRNDPAGLADAPKADFRCLRQRRGVANHGGGVRAQRFEIDAGVDACRSADAALVVRQNADAEGNALLNLPPALLAATRSGLVLLGMSSRTVTPFEAPA